MSDIYYTKDHEWVLVEGDEVTVGITSHAQEQLGDIVYVELPEIGAEFSQGKNAAVVESVKAASEIYAPISGSVTSVNGALDDDPSLVNQDSEGSGWFFKMRLSDRSELSSLLDKSSYDALVSEGS